MKYGLPYKGSKNKLATRIVGILPQRKHLYDLFCGGCAVTHAAMMTKKFQYFHINDINWMCPTLFRDVLNGKYDNETRWISREDFFRLKDTDPYVAFVWSFGNNLRDYIYGKDIEPIKKAIHYAMFYSDYSLAADMGHDLTFIDDIEDMQSRYLAIKHYFEAYGNTRMQSFEGGADYAARTLQQEHSPCSHGGGQNASRLETHERQRHLLSSDLTKCRVTNHPDSVRGCQKKTAFRRVGETEHWERQCHVCNTGNATTACHKGGGKKHSSPLMATIRM